MESERPLSLPVSVFTKQSNSGSVLVFIIIQLVHERALDMIPARLVGYLSSHIQRALVE